MSDVGDPIAPAALPLGHEPRKRSQQFRRSATAPMLTREQRQRQTTIMQVTMSAFDARDAVIAFLNTYHDGLGGRPLDVALESDDGLAKVTASIASVQSVEQG